MLWIIVIELVCDKFKVVGYVENEKLVDQIVDQLFGVGFDDDDGNDGDVFEFEFDEEIVFEFMDVDMVCVQDYVDKISEMILDLIYIVVEMVVVKMLC